MVRRERNQERDFDRLIFTHRLYLLTMFEGGKVKREKGSPTTNPLAFGDQVGNFSTSSCI